MESSNDLLEELIKSAIANHSFADPLNDDFDRSKLLDYIKPDLESGSYDVKEGSKGQQLLFAVLDLNMLYKQLIDDVIDQISQIPLSNRNLIERVLAHVNFDYCSMRVDSMPQEPIKGPTRVTNVSELGDKEYTNIFGQTGNVSDAVDISVDVCNELLEIIHDLDDIDNENQRVDDVDIDTEVRKLFMILNYLVNLKEAFRFVKYEFGTISRTASELIFRHEPEYYYLIRLAGKDRESSLTQEGHFHLMGAPTPKTKMPQIKVIEDTIIFEGEQNVPETILHNTIVLSSTFYQHLDGYKLSKLNDITIDDILHVLSILHSPFQLINVTEIVTNCVRQQKLTNVPVRIEKKHLISVLKKLTKLPEKVIQSILSVITADFNSNVDLWRFPLMSSDKYYYFSLVSAAYGHTTFWADQIINSFLAQGTQEKLFIKFLKSAIQSWDTKYRVLIADASSLRKLSVEGNFLIVAFGATCLIIEPCLYSYPLSSRGYRRAIDSLFVASNRLNDRKAKIAAEAGKLFNTKVVRVGGLLITNHPLLSGLVVEEVPVLDSIAFKNYFTIGEYQRSTLSIKNQSAQSTTLSSYRYYDTEDEFGAKFAQFSFRCPLIYEKMKTHKIRPHPISFPDSRPIVLRDGSETIKLEESIWTDVHELDLCLKQMFYFGDELDRKPELQATKVATEERIQYLMPIVMNYIALDRSDRFARNHLLNIFKNSRLIGMSYLVFALDQMIGKLGDRPIRKKEKTAATPIDSEAADLQMKRFLEMNMKPAIELSLSTWETKHDFIDSEQQNLLRFLETVLSDVYQKKYSEDELDTFMLPLIVYIKLAGNDKRFRSAQYSMMINFVELLNYNGYYQKARDFSEEVLEFSFRNPDHPAIGWLVQFKCFLKQNSVFDAAFYGNLYFATLITIGEIDEEEAFDGIYNSMLFAREFGYQDMVESIYLSLKSFPLSSYDSQKITISYFNSKISDPKQFTTKRDEMMKYIDDNIQDIVDMARHAVVPWIVFLYNIKLLIKKKLIDPVDKIDNYLAMLESKIPKEEVEYLHALVFPAEASKGIFLGALVRAYETRQFDDYASEMGGLRALAYNTFLNSIQPIDVKYLLLTGLVLNDNRLTFQATESNGQTSRFATKKELELREYLNDYSAKLINRIQLKPHQLLIWVAEIHGEVLCVYIESDKNIRIEKLDLWDIKKQYEWAKEIAGFTFDDKREFPINEQEGKYINLLEHLNFAKLTIKGEIKELLVTTSVTVANFPSNLIQFEVSKKNNLPLHEERVKEAIAQNDNFDFTSFHLAVSNVISLEWFSLNGGDVSMGASDQLILQAWVPTDDGDFVLEMGYEKLKPIIDKYKGSISTDLVPKEPLCGKINVVMAHGGKGFEGFRGVYSTHEAGHAYVGDRKRMEKVYGKGEIAVLFICSSALISQEIYVQRLVSFTHEILAIGYKAVVAPAWDLNPLITPGWLDNFLENLMNGYPAGEATQMANVYVSRNGFDEHTGFYFPAGWAAMHYYGNPNIFCVEAVS